MRKKVFILLITIIFIPMHLFSQNRDLRVQNIIDDPATFRNRKIVLRLKLKNVDRVFEKIVFYDKDNIDIEFDISDKKLKKNIKKDMHGIHEGMDYFVEFTVIESASGMIRGELHGFTPAILEKIPGKGK